MSRPVQLASQPLPSHTEACTPLTGVLEKGRCVILRELAPDIQLAVRSLPDFEVGGQSPILHRAVSVRCGAEFPPRRSENRDGKAFSVPASPSRTCTDSHTTGCSSIDSTAGYCVPTFICNFDSRC